MFDLTGKNAFITGALGGIGKAIAVSMHKQGANLILSDMNEEKLQVLADELNSTRANSAMVYVLSLTDRDAIKDAPKQLKDAFGSGVDILVNCAGIINDSFFVRMSDDKWDKVIDINLTAPFLLRRAFVRTMSKKKWGRIINLASISPFVGNGGQANYASSKAGLIGLTKTIANEYAKHNVTANVIAPGFVATPMTEHFEGDMKNEIIKHIPMERMATSEEIAAAAVYFASNEAGFTTGTTLHVNGGMYFGL